MCPPEDTEIIDTDVGKKPVFWSDGQTIMDHWVKLLRDSPKKCVDVVASLSGEDHYAQTFDLWYVIVLLYSYSVKVNYFASFFFFRSM